MLRSYACSILVSTLLASFAEAAPAPLTEEKIEAAIEKAGGTVTRQNMGKTAKVTFEKMTDYAALSLKNAEFVTCVEILDGSRCGDRTMAVIGTLSNLESLSIHKSGITDIGMANFRKLDKLKTLYLAESKITDVGVAALADVTDLEDLDLTASKITDKSIDTIERLTSLKTLGLTSTRVTDRGMLKLQKMPSLEDINLMFTMVSTQAIKEMEKANPKLKIRR